ncbi:hypothetical protein [Ferruginibacter sp. HRS2-29]|uniref:hypothetical protein n=1 Tax=Ferruginibacter sp. HRS2-29 TaxID=2487334 RepID=UPI0020CE682D|nr:hypothetical protein [Ferruginibacter sp. HRS2-29]MCP9752416.1 hypothetical protein [Ferruginibacter sp. HRS2-29]
MQHPQKDPSIDPSSLPEKTFSQKEVFQHKQPADSGNPLGDEYEIPKDVCRLNEKDETAKEEGLNEERSAGEAGAFEGFEDQGK